MNRNTTLNSNTRRAPRLLSAVMLACVIAVMVSGPPRALGHPEDPKAKAQGPPYKGRGYVGKSLAPNSAGDIMGFDAAGVVLHSWLTLDDLPSNSFAANDIWGYVSPAGREYAIIGVKLGVAYVDITEPASPSIAGFIGSGCSVWGDFATHNEFAYSVMDLQCSAGTGTGLRIHDLARIDEGIVEFVRQIRVLFPTDNFAMPLDNTHNVIICESTGFLYLLGSNLYSGGLVIMDLNADPTDPPNVGNWPDAYIHDAVVHQYADGPFAGREIVFAATGDVGLTIIDATDKADVFTLATRTYPNLDFAHACWLDDDQKYLYLGDELDEFGDPNIPSTTYIFDVEDIENPTFSGSFTNGLDAVDHNLMGRGNLLFEANYTSGLRVFDISNVNNVQEVAYFDTLPEDNNRGFRGAWGVYSRFPSGTIIVSDIFRGLFVIGLDRNGPLLDAADWTRY